MDDRDPPPIPGRPERIARSQTQTSSNPQYPIHSIANLRPVTQANDYVETSGLPSRIGRLQNLGPEKNNSDNDKQQEQKENIQNERKELLQHAPPPELPPRRPPPRQASLHQQRDTAVIPKTKKLKPRSAPRAPPQTINREMTDNATVLISTPNQGWLLLPPIRRQINNNQPTTNHETITQPITAQPTNDITLSVNGDGTFTNSIMCKNCKQCRCASCTGERELPEHWLCDDTCRCNAETVVNTLSCMYCATHCLHLCSDNRKKTRDFCSCTGSASSILARWTALTALSTVLPCLCCYWPLRGCAAAIKACYNSRCVRQKGCTCDQQLNPN